MAKLPTSGVSTARPPFGREKLDEILDHLSAEHEIALDLDDENRESILRRIGFINGSHLQQKDRLDASDIAHKIRSVGSSLDSIIEVLAALEGGLHRSEDCEAAVQIADAFKHHKALNEISDAHERLCSLVAMSRDVRDVCQIKVAELQGLRGKPGRPRQEWHDEFTALLVDLAEGSGINPVVVTNHVNGERTGPFIELALAFEYLLFDDSRAPELRMRSASRAACAKRLERSLERLPRR